MIRILALVTDAYGGTGGIAQYNRDFLEAVAAHEGVNEIVVLPRVIARVMQPRPKSVIHVESAANSKVRYLAKVAQLTSRPNRFDLIICGHVHLLPAAWLAARRCGAKVLLMVYGLEVWTKRSWPMRYMLRRTDAVVAISAFTTGKMREWVSIPENRIFLVPNGIDLSEYTPGPKNEDLRQKLRLGPGPILLTLGRMDADEKAKGFDEVLEAIPSLLEDFPTLTYCLAGDGTDRARLEQKAGTLGVGEHCVFTGYVDEAAKLDLYRLSDLYVMPSRLEGFGYVFLEALAAGVPVVASSVDGSREAVRGGAWGILADPRNHDEVVNAIKSGLVNPKVPDRSELDYFSKDKFRTRVGQALAGTIQ
ncbi:MAG TPA: glycosyltransferase family 4 protein [Gemmatimonadaceae bacterium]|nr:glycosyltransferase family 4 protein [Gemmatimonadaceae bacterium]